MDGTPICFAGSGKGGLFLEKEAMMEDIPSGRAVGRLSLLDTLRGITLMSMILYHAAWDAVYLLEIQWEWYHGTGAFIWQQSICWTFILLSGFCLPLGRHPMRRGVEVFGAGLLVTAVTVLVIPENRVVFGVLTLLGSCMVLTGGLDRLLKMLPPVAGIIGSGLMFLLTRWVNDGFLGWESLWTFQLPDWLYHGFAMTYLGFPEPGFVSTDYFSLIPWCFLFWVGYYLGRIGQRTGFHGRGWKLKLPLLDWMGRHSLLIYLLHQPILYIGTMAVGAII